MENIFKMAICFSVVGLIVNHWQKNEIKNQAKCKHSKFKHSFEINFSAKN